MNLNARRKRGISAFFALIGLLLMSSGVAVMVATGPAQADDDCEPAAAYTETTDWVTASPGSGWYQVDSRTVTDAAAYDEEVVDTPAYDDPPTTSPKVWHVYTGPHGDTPPPLDDPLWAPHDNSPDGQHAYPGENGLNVPYRPGSNEGNGDWFYWSGGVTTPGEHHDAVTHTVHHDAVTHEEYKFAFDHAAVPCDEVDPPVVVVDPPVDNPPADKPPAHKPPAHHPTTNTPAHHPAAQPAPHKRSVVSAPKVPSQVEAGIVEDVSSTTQGLTLVGAGALLMMVGGLGMARRRGVVARS